MKPDYAFWDRQKRFIEFQVIYLWCDMEPPPDYDGSAKVEVVARQLEQAKIDGAVEFDVERTEQFDGDIDIEVWFRRKALVAYAELIGYRPPFLFPAQREIATVAIKSEGNVGRIENESYVPVTQSNSESELSDVKGANALLTVDQFCEKHPEFTEGSLRFSIFHAVKRVDKKTGKTTPANGLAPAIKRIGRRVRIDERLFLDWWAGRLKEQG